MAVDRPAKGNGRGVQWGDERALDPGHTRRVDRRDDGDGQGLAEGTGIVEHRGVKLGRPPWRGGRVVTVVTAMWAVMVRSVGGRLKKRRRKPRRAGCRDLAGQQVARHEAGRNQAADQQAGQRDTPTPAMKGAFAHGREFYPRTAPGGTEKGRGTRVEECKVPCLVEGETKGPAARTSYDVAGVKKFQFRLECRALFHSLNRT